MFKVIIVSIVCLFVCLFVFQQLDPRVQPSNNNESSLIYEDNKIDVTIEGEIAIPGNYKMEVSQNLQDLVLKAGGLLETADVNAINLDVIIAEHDYFYIPSKSTSSNTCKIKPDIVKVNINIATSSELATVNYISLSLGEKIVKYREENGPFEALEDLMKVSGIGRATYERIRDYLTLK